MLWDFYIHFRISKLSPLCLLVLTSNSAAKHKVSPHKGLRSPWHQQPVTSMRESLCLWLVTASLVIATMSASTLKQLQQLQLPVRSVPWGGE